ncbi:MAG: flavin-containing monooxygenase [Acidimicrobiales bacterium]
MHVDVAIIGSGFGGLGAAIRLRQRGIDDVVILERSSQLGGTWRDNTYPGCRVDVPSALYSFSFAPNPDWTSTYSYQAEIWAYLERVASDYHLNELIRFDHTVSAVTFDETARRWRLVTSHGHVEARAVVLAVGGLSAPRLPEIDGVGSFTGPVMHTAQWDDAVVLAGRRVGVIGTGASAIQVVPEIAPVVGSLAVFQRTPSWVLPHEGHPVTSRTRALFHRLPVAQRLQRLWQYATRERLVLGFVKDPQRMVVAEKWGRQLLDAQVADPELRTRLTPAYRLGCKRALLSNDFYPAIGRDNVSLITDAITRIEPGGVRTADGVLHELDVLIYATGFHVTDNPIGDIVTGTTGVKLAEAFCGELPAYKGTTFPGFPNLFMLGGPNTALGHSSIIYMIESQLNYVGRALEVALRRGALVEPTPIAAAAWTNALRAKLPGTVWGTGCSSWYLNDLGLNTTIWPGFTFEYRRATRHFVAQDHRVTVPHDGGQRADTRTPAV